jgi:beta-glucosidase
MVLLKNDGVLPLRGIKHVLVVGPLADQTAVLLGNYNGTPTHTVTVLEGLKAEFPKLQITYVPGTQFLSNHGTPVAASALTTAEGQPGLKAEYSAGVSLDASSTAVTSRIEPSVDLNSNTLPAQARGMSALAVHWTGMLHPEHTGDYLLGIRAAGSSTVTVDGQQVVQMYSPGTTLGPVHLEQGRSVPLDVQYSQGGSQNPQAQLIWAPVNNNPDPAAVSAAKHADVIIAVVGITSRLEGEEMRVDQPGFLGGDRTSLDLPKPEEDLLQALGATQKPLVVVLTNGSALGLNWEKEHASAILESWYAGEEGGSAIAQTLSGKNNPAGRLPVTFYKNVQQLPPFEDYSMKGRTYRYYQGEPLWPFGYGLSYTTFRYTGLDVPQAPLKAGDPLDVAVTVTNTGPVSGDEVVQLYLNFPQIAGAPLRALRGFQRVHLAPGAGQRVQFHLNPRDLSMVTAAGDTIVAEGAYTVSIGGGQPNTEAASSSARFAIAGQLTLPE